MAASVSSTMAFRSSESRLAEEERSAESGGLGASGVAGAARFTFDSESFAATYANWRSSARAAAAARRFILALCARPFESASGSRWKLIVMLVGTQASYFERRRAPSLKAARLGLESSFESAFERFVCCGVPSTAGCSRFDFASPDATVFTVAACVRSCERTAVAARCFSLFSSRIASSRLYLRPSEPRLSGSRGDCAVRRTCRPFQTR
eukprot:1608627-Prymnesium_polylepis.3